MDSRETGSDYVRVADIAVETVRPTARGFLLEGHADDGGDYRLELELEFPLDRRTRSVLGELLAQSDWRLARRARPPLARPARAARDARQRRST